MMTILLQQNRILMSPAAGASGAKRPNLLDILAGGGTHAFDEGKAVSAARWCAARIALKEQMMTRLCAVTQSLRRNLVRAPDKASDKTDIGDKRQSLSRDVPLGNLLCLTYLSFQCAQTWEEAEAVAAELDGAEADPKLFHLFPSLHITIGLSCALADQVAVEAGIEYLLGWLIANQEGPPSLLTQQHKSQPGSVLPGELVEPASTAAQLAHSKGLDVVAKRLRRRPATGPPEGRGDERGGN